MQKLALAGTLILAMSMLSCKKTGVKNDPSLINDVSQTQARAALAAAALPVAPNNKVA